MGRETRAARREAGSEARAANGLEGAWRCREEAVGGGRGRRRLCPLARAGWDAPGGRGGSVRGNGKTGKGPVVAGRPVRERTAGSERGRKRRYRRAAGEAVKKCPARASVTPCGARAREENGSAVKTRGGM